MAPWYVKHKAGEDKHGKKRKNDCFIHYYLCAKQQKQWKTSDHKNCASARKTEDWVWERLRDLTTSETIINTALDAARQNARKDLEPVYEAYSQTGEALRKVEADIDKVLESASSGKAVGALWDMLNERAFRLKFERDQLLIEQRRLKEQVTPAEIGVDDHSLRTRLQSLEIIRKAAEPEELQRLLRLMVRRVEWSPEGKHKVQLYVLPPQKPKACRLKEPTGSGFIL